jgi:hypothetical protein
MSHFKHYVIKTVKYNSNMILFATECVLIYVYIYIYIYVCVCVCVCVCININTCSVPHSPNLNHTVYISWVFRFHLNYSKFLILYFKILVHYSSAYFSGYHRGYTICVF